MRIRYPGWKNLDSGTGIQDKYPGSATLQHCSQQYDFSQIRQRDLHMIQILLPGAKVFRRTV